MFLSSSFDCSIFFCLTAEVIFFMEFFMWICAFLLPTLILKLREESERGKQDIRSALLAQKHEWTSIFLLLTLWARPSVNCRPSSKTVYPDRKYLTPLLICIRCWDMFQFVVLAFATSLSENVILEALSKCVVGFPAEVQIPLFKNF